jgi:hypothetical protein
MKSTNVYYHFKEATYNDAHKTKSTYKVVRYTPFVSNELTISQTIAKIPNYSTFFHIYLEMVDDRTMLGNKPNEIMLKIADAQLIYLKNYLKALSSPKLYICTIINFYKTYLKSIQLLVDRQIVHNCIQFDALMVNLPNATPIITDFSVSLNILKIISLDYIRPFFIQYDPEYITWPIELHILSFLLTNKLPSLSLTNIQNIIRDTSRSNTVLQTFGTAIVSTYETEALEYFGKYVNKSVNYIVSDIFYYYDTWDNYALSIVFLRILIGVHKSISTGTSTSKQNKFIILFMKLLVGNIHFNPLKRLSICNTTNKIEEIMDTIDVNEWSNLVVNLTKSLFTTTTASTST